MNKSPKESESDINVTIRNKWIEEKVKEFEKEFISIVARRITDNLTMIGPGYEQFLHQSLEEAWTQGQENLAETLTEIGIGKSIEDESI